jgi:hypothetical protein
MTLECRGQFGRKDFIEFIQFVSTFEVESVGVLFYYCTSVPGDMGAVSMNVCSGYCLINLGFLFGFVGSLVWCL